jgi:hypothetical protein
MRAILVPVGSVIEVLKTRENEDRMVEVGWEGNTVSLFARDVLERGIRMKAAHAEQGEKSPLT